MSNILNETVRGQLAHRTIREFTADPIPEETMQTLFQVAMQTASARFLQAASIIRVQDQTKRDALARIGKQEYVARAPEYLLFVADARRSAKILAESGTDQNYASSAQLFREAFTDACLMAQNVVVAAESLGLGTNYLANIFNDVAGVIDLLELPEFVFPVLGLTLGKPNQKPQLKPRIPAKFRVMTDTYQEPESWTETLADYDQEVQTYYDLRAANRRVDAFTTQTVRALAGDKRNDQALIRAIVAQGFAVGYRAKDEG
ncbi:MAG: nitroreductase family protein [Trueperella sp.]|nr:nitroreductase family protein [Trueperella sp.]